MMTALAVALGIVTVGGLVGAIAFFVSRVEERTLADDDD